MQENFCQRCRNKTKVGSIGTMLIRECVACGLQKTSESGFSYTLSSTAGRESIARHNPMHYLDPTLERWETNCPNCEDKREVVCYKADKEGHRGMTCTTCGVSWK